MRHGLFAALLGLSLLAACNVTEVPLAPSAVAENHCESNDDCRGQVCNSEGACVAGATLISELLVQVTPPAAFKGVGGLTFYKTLDPGKAKDGRIDIELDPVAHVDGRVEVDEACVPGNAKVLTIPVDVSFTPSQQILGIATSLYTASVDLASEAVEHTFTAEIPTGDYDVYIKPKPGGGCEIPPHLLLKQELAGNLDVNLPVPRTLPVKIHWPNGQDLTGWTAALLDEPTGRVISTQPALAEGVQDEAGAWVYTANVAYYIVKSPEEPAKSGADPAEPGRARILRLTPPTGTERPSLLGENLGVIEQKGELPPNVTVQGQTAIMGKAVPVEATLKITAMELEGFDAGILAAYSRTLAVSPEGLFELSLPPGSYHVEATPVGASADCAESGVTELSPCLAVATTTWNIGVQPALQAGRLLEFPPATRVTGHARLWTNAAPLGAMVHLSASPVGRQTGLINTYLGDTQPLPRAASGLVRSDSSFSFNADPGLFDLIVQTDSSTRFGWYVWSVSLPQVADIGTISVPAPAAYSGKVRIGVGGESRDSLTIPNVLIRAFADADGKPGGHMVAVAETWANDQGSFELLIPRQLGPAPILDAAPGDDDAR